MKKLFFLLLFTLSAVCFSSEEANNYTGLQIGEKAKILDKTKDYNLRLYCFVELSSCSICTNWAIYFGEKYQDSNMEIVMILNNTTQEDADKLKKDLDWKLTVIGDEYGVFHSFYKIKFPVTMLVLDYEGILLDAGKLASPKMSGEHIDELLEIEKKRVKPNDSQNYMKLKEISRIPVMKDSIAVFSGMFRDALYDRTHNKYIIKNMRSCRIDIADSNGNIYKSLYNSDFYHCVVGGYPIGWVYQDSVVAVLTAYIDSAEYITEIAYLNTITDSIYRCNQLAFDLDQYKCGVFMDNEFFNVNNKELCAYLQYSGNTNKNISPNDTCFYVYDMEGNILKKFGMYDDVYRKYKLSSFASLSVTFNNKGEAITTQNHSKNLQFWDKNKELIKTKEMDLLNDFRLLNQDIKDDGDEDYIAELSGKISQFPSLYCDRANNNIVYKWLNQTYPEGVTDFFSSEVKNQIFLCLFDKDGNRLFDKNILMPSTFLIHGIYDNKIFGTELNRTKLELVVYSLDEK